MKNEITVFNCGNFGDLEITFDEKGNELFLDWCEKWGVKVK
jgi:hypothetical protein